MGEAVVTLPDGQKAKITFESQEQLNAAVEDLNKQSKVAKQDSMVHGDHEMSDAIAETGIHLASGMVAGLAGGANYLGTLIASGGDTGAAKAVQEETQDKLTYEPRTKGGKAITGAIAAPFKWLAGKADEAGQWVSEKTGSPALGAATNVAIQAAPGAVVPAARAAMYGGATALSEELTASEIPRTPPSEVPRGTPPPETPPKPAAQPQGEAQAKPSSDPTQTANEEAAKAYAARIGLDWSSLGAGVRKSLQTIAQDSRALDRLDPAAVRRQATLESQRVPLRGTRAQLTQNPVDLRREAIVSRTDEGAPIRETDVQNNAAVQANLEILRGRVGGKRGGFHEPTDAEGKPAPAPSIREPTKIPSQVGEAAQKALRDKAMWSKKGYQALYKKARETEADAQAHLTPLTDLLTENPEIQHLGWVNSWLNKAAKAKAAREGTPTEGEPVQMDSVTLNELHDLRSKANDIARTGGKEGYYASQVVKAIDTAMQDVPEGAKAWKAANDAFKKHQQEFKNQELVSALSSDKKGSTARRIALEDTWNKVATGNLEQLKEVKRSLLTGGDIKTRAAGRRAWRDLRAETINRILEDARNVVTTDESEKRILTAVALKRSIGRIPRENLMELLGPRAVRELDGIMRSREITKGRTTESGTVPNMLVLMEKVLNHIPGVGKYAAGAVRTAHKIGEVGKSAREARRATETPLEEAAKAAERSKPAKQARKKARRARQEEVYREIEGGGPTLPAPASEPTIGDALSSQQPTAKKPRQ